MNTVCCKVQVSCTTNNSKKKKTIIIIRQRLFEGNEVISTLSKKNLCLKFLIPEAEPKSKISLLEGKAKGVIMEN